MKFVYSGNVTLPRTSGLWRFVYTGGMGTGSSAGRSAAITNINAASTTFQLIDTLNNSIAPNSSPVFSDSLRTTFCINQHNVFAPSPTDADGDSLYVLLTNATNGSGGGGSAGACAPGGNCSYTGEAWPGMPMSGTNPIKVLPDSFQLNHHTGELSFFSNVSQRPSIVYNVREFRSGVLVGTSQHELNFTVLSCSGAYTCLAGECSGTPIAGTVNATVNGCAPFMSTLSLSGGTLANNLAWQWQSSPDSASWSDIAGATNETYTGVFTGPGYYRCIVSCTGSGGKDTSANAVHILAEAAVIPIVSITSSEGMHIGPHTRDTLTAHVINGGSNPSYQWVINGIILPADTNAMLVRNHFSNNDSVSCIVTNRDACGLYSFNSVIIFVDPTGISLQKTGEEIMVMPNPNKGIFSLVGALNNISTLEITNMFGTVVFKSQTGGNSGKINEQTVNIADAPAGVYFIRINGAMVQKFVKM